MTQTRTKRIEARISPDALSIVKRAAEIQGRSISDFVVAAAQDVAKRTVEEMQVIKLSLADQERFFDAILNPKPLTAAMKRAIKTHRALIRSSK
jgi:uncharacterized protein (DUF1778 family)